MHAQMMRKMKEAEKAKVRRPTLNCYPCIFAVYGILLHLYFFSIVWFIASFMLPFSVLL
jgi:hypothetical protein